jgi:hypothetical protein
MISQSRIDNILNSWIKISFLHPLGQTIGSERLNIASILFFVHIKQSLDNKFNLNFPKIN